MAISINGSGTITGVSVGGLPDGIVDTDMLATSAVSPAKMGYDGAVLRVVNTVKTDTFSTASQSFTVVAGLTASITPRFSDSKILIIASVHFSADAGANSCSFAIGKGGSQLLDFAADAAGNRIRAAMHGYPSDGATHVTENEMFSSTVTCLDSPATTSEITYSVMMRAANAATMYVNRTLEDRDAADYDPRTISTLTLMEVAA